MNVLTKPRMQSREPTLRNAAKRTRRDWQQVGMPELAVHIPNQKIRYGRILLLLLTRIWRI